MVLSHDIYFLSMNINDINSTATKATRDGFGQGLLEAGRQNPNIVGLTADLMESLQMQHFQKEFPERFFQIGIAEANMMGIAAGSLEGVQNGDMAQQAFLEAIDPATTPERREELRLQLHDYCELDTLALVRIWEIFTGRRAR